LYATHDAFLIGPASIAVTLGGCEVAQADQISN
jgi:hypothetical protein